VTLLYSVPGAPHVNFLIMNVVALEHSNISSALLQYWHGEPTWRNDAHFCRCQVSRWM